jgi:hypothetical protein
MRAADGRRPTVVLGSELVVNLAQDAEVTLNGLWRLDSHPCVVETGTLRLRHCTLIPGSRSTTDAQQPTAPSIVIESDMVMAVEIDHSIVGGIRAHEDATVKHHIEHRHARPHRRAYSAIDGVGAGGEIRVVNSTVIGKCTRVLRLGVESILSARLADGCLEVSCTRAAPGRVCALLICPARLAHTAAVSLSARERGDALRAAAVHVRSAMVPACQLERPLRRRDPALGR